jgi:elongation factor 2
MGNDDETLFSDEEGEEVIKDGEAAGEEGEDGFAKLAKMGPVVWNDKPFPEALSLEASNQDKVEHRVMMSHPSNIRNIAVIAHVDHGKTTLTDSLVARAGLLNERTTGNARCMDTRADEQERGITIKSTGITLYFEVKKREEALRKPYLINLVDSPGHVDFSSEVTAALRITDGALVVVDCIDSICCQTETVLRQALKERVKPILFMNKMDRIIFEKCLGAEDIYQSLSKTVESINVIISTYQDPALPDVQVSMEACNVGMGSALQGWAFTLEPFASVLAAKFGLDFETMKTCLWGNNFYSSSKKIWVKEKGTNCHRGFCKFVLEPVIKVCKAGMENDWPVLDKMLGSLELKISKDDRELVGKALTKKIMRLWLNAADALLAMICAHLPSPAEAQRYRMETLYEGPMGDECSRAIRACDPDGPVMMFVSKMVPAPDGNRFYAFGRVFSGTIATGQSVRIQGSRYTPEKNIDVSERKIQRVVLMMGSKVESVESVPAGNLCALVGLDKSILKTATISTCKTAYNIVPMQYQVAPVVQVSVRPKQLSDLPKMIEALKRLSKSDPLLEVIFSESGEHVIAASGELHLQVALHDLETEYFNGPVIAGEPVVSYRETVQGETAVPCLSKSPNKHNRLYMTAQPLGDELADAIDAGDIPMQGDTKPRIKALVTKHGWDKTAAIKLWCFGPEETGANAMVEQTVGVQIVLEIKPHVASGFQWATKTGPMAEEPMRGIRFNLTDAHLHTDAIHRGAGQLMGCTRRALFASVLSSEPRLQEPMFRADIQVPSDCSNTIFSVLAPRRGTVVSEERKDGTPLVDLICHLPVAESFGFVTSLRAATSGRAFANLTFSHWAMLPGDPLVPGKVADIVKACRTRKGLKTEAPPLSEYLDKL